MMHSSSGRPAVPFEEAIEQLPEPARSETRRVFQESLTHYRNLREIRETLEKTQAEVAAKMGITPAALSRLERKADVYVGTLRRAIASLGGELEVTIRFPDREPIRLGLADD